MSPVFVCGSSHGHRGPRWLARARSGSRDRLSEVPTTITSRSREAALSLVSMRKRSSCPVDQLLCPDKGIADWTCPLRVYGSEQSWHATEPPAVHSGEQQGALASPRRNMPGAVSTRGSWATRCEPIGRELVSGSCLGYATTMAFFRDSRWRCASCCWSNDAAGGHRGLPRRPCHRRLWVAPRRCVRGSRRRR